jgi:FMN phosphatase YigB (HAD superfamily)
VARRAKIEPARSLFVDDLRADVEAARLADFQAEVFDNETQLRALLGARGVIRP